MGAARKLDVAVTSLITAQMSHQVSVYTSAGTRDAAKAFKLLEGMRNAESSSNEVLQPEKGLTAGKLIISMSCMYQP